MQKTYVLDANVLLQAPYALESFEDNNIVLPLAVLEELDALKGADGEAGNSARQALRFLEDLRLRGPGDFFGLRQHGLPGLRVADIGCDTRLLAEAQSAADGLLAEDPALTHHPATAERVQKLFQQSENSLN